MPDEKPGYWLSLLKSFDPKFYKNILGQSFGRSFVYIMLLSFLVSSLLAVKIKIEYDKFASMSRVWIEEHIDNIWPKGLVEIKIENGQVSSDVQQPYMHKWNDFVFILDTTGSIKSLADYNQGILVVKDKILVKSKKSRYETRVQEYDLSRLERFVISPGDTNKGIIAEIKAKNKLFNISMKLISFWIRFIGGIIFFAVLLILFSFYLSAKIIQGVLFALFSMLPNKIIGANLNYAKLLNISLYALTPVSILSVIIIMAGIKLLFFWFVSFFIYMSYIILGIKNIKDNSIEVNSSPFLTGGE